MLKIMVIEELLIKSKYEENKHTGIFSESDYGVATVSKLYQTVSRIIMLNLKLLGQFLYAKINENSYPLRTY